MLPWLLVVVSVGVLIAWRCGSRFGRIPARKRKLAPSERILVVTAHPDDECMFFGPFILTAVQKWGAEVFLLCCSTGNHDGNGKVREKELLDAAERLGVSTQNVRCLNDRDLLDGPNKKWKAEKIAAVVSKHISEWKATIVVTFDVDGVSGHRNHCDLAYAVTAMQKEERLPHGVRVLLLDTVNCLRKYSKYFDVALTIHKDFDLITLVGRLDETVVSTAMRTHRSQMVWFRWLYISFSRYMILNTFTEVFVDRRKN